MLTHKQHDLLMFIDRRLKESGVSPSFDEMKEALGLRSKSGIHRLLVCLEERGFLRRHHHRARALEVIKMPPHSPDKTPRAMEPDEAVAAPGEGSFAPNVIRGDFSSRLPGVRAAEEAAAVQLPLYGRISAGLPIGAVNTNNDLIEVPTALLAQGEHYALEVAGDSMIDAGILDSDIVVIRRSDTAENGEIVVALVAEEEVTLKRLRRRGNSIALEPANPTHKVQIFPADQVRIQGRLVALLRRY